MRMVGASSTRSGRQGSALVAGPLNTVPKCEQIAVGVRTAHGAVRVDVLAERAEVDKSAGRVRSGAAMVAVTLCAACGWLFPSEPKEDTEFGRPAVLVWEVPGVGTGRVSSDDERVYFPGLYHTLTAVDKRNGTVVWEASTGLPTPLTLGRGTAIAGSVVVMADGYLYAFDRRTGVRRWLFVGEPGTAAGNAVPAGSGSLIFAGSQTGTAYALAAETGEVVWATPTPVPFPSKAFDPVVDGDLVFFGYAEQGGERQGGLAALDVATGAVVWVHDFTADVAPESARCNGAVTVHGNTVFAGIDNGAVFALDRLTGAILWQSPGTHPSNEVRHSAVVRNVLIVGSVSSHVTGFDPSTGSTVWDRNLDQGSLVTPFTSGDSLAYLATIGSVFLAVEPATGTVRWNAGLSDGRYYGFFGTAAIDSANVYIGGGQGLFAFRR